MENTPPTQPDLNADRVTSVLNAEIVRLKETQRDPSWTNWALVVGVSTLFWAASGLLSSVHYSKALVRLILGLSIFVDIAYATVRTTEVSDGQTRFRRFGERIPGFIYLVFFVLRSSSIIVGMRWVSGHWTFSAVAVAIDYGLFLIIGLTMIGLNLSKRPWPVQKEMQWQAQVVILVLGLGLMLGMISLTWSALIDWRTGLIDANDLRIAGILVAITVLGGKLIEQRPHTGVMTLEGVRRDLAFGKIDVATAVKRADAAIYGMTFSEYVEQHVSTLLRLVGQATTELQQAEAEVDTLEVAVKSIEGSSPQSREALVRATRASVGVHRDRAMSLVTEAQEVGKELDRRMANGTKSERDALASKLKEVLDGVKTQASGVLEKTKKMGHVS